MAHSQILVALTARGAHLAAQGDRVRLVVLGDPLPDAELAELRDRKAELLAAVRARPWLETYAHQIVSETLLAAAQQHQPGRFNAAAFTGFDIAAGLAIGEKNLGRLLTAAETYLAAPPLAKTGGTDQAPGDELEFEFGGKA